MLQTTPEYITLDDAIRIVTKWSGVSELQIEGLTKLPAADVAPVRHGKWILYDANDLIDRCSLCGEEKPSQMFYHSNYCPHCGAKMDGTKNE